MLKTHILFCAKTKMSQLPFNLHVKRLDTTDTGLDVTAETLGLFNVNSVGGEAPATCQFQELSAYPGPHHLINLFIKHYMQFLVNI